MSNPKSGLKASVYTIIEEMSCPCSRCECVEDCFRVVFVVQHGFDYETILNMCEGCYGMYRELYITHIEGDEDPTPPDIVE